MTDETAFALEASLLLREPQAGPVDSKACVVCAALVIVLDQVTEQEDTEGMVQAIADMAEHAEFGHPEDERTRSMTEKVFRASEGCEQPQQPWEFARLDRRTRVDPPS
ncbi:hypothetical protein [Streptomyces sp. NPDC058045]|uniref:hypothetical protein n=1 Tax=Streptomyces sp. NPDC058045 TaxID=3346311 RepID=UPI0036EA62B9